MSVYRPKDKTGKEAPFYVYDFQLGGRRFSGNTGATSERAAKRIEAEKREEAKRQLEVERAAGGAPWSFGKAITAYYNEVLGGKLDPSTKSIFTWLQREVENETPLLSITMAFVADLIVRRSKEPGKRKGSRVSPATINRTVTEPLRRILRYAQEIHAQPIPKIKWNKLLKDENNVRIRELKSDEEERLFENLREDYHDIIRFSIITGVRLGECCSLTWDNVDFGNRRLTIRRKGGKVKSVPISPSARVILWAQKGRNPTFVFTYVAERSTANPNTKTRYIKGERYPITYEGLKTAFRRDRDAAEIVNLRFHDLRHTAGSRILRKSRNLLAVKEILGHENIQTTMRYVHVLDDDLIEAMEAGAASANATSPTESPMEDNSSGNKKDVSEA